MLSLIGGLRVSLMLGELCICMSVAMCICGFFWLVLFVLDSFDMVFVFFRLFHSSRGVEKRH